MAIGIVRFPIEHGDFLQSWLVMTHLENAISSQDGNERPLVCTVNELDNHDAAGKAHVISTGPWLLVLNISHQHLPTYPQHLPTAFQGFFMFLCPLTYLGKLEYFTHLNSSAIKGDDSHPFTMIYGFRSRRVRSWSNLPRYSRLTICKP